MNTVNITGRLVRDNELKKIGEHSNIQNTIAVNRNYTNSNGEREADFINIVAWRGTADILARYTRKGSLIGITGRIQTRNYENQQGQRVYVTEVVAESVDLLEPKNSQKNDGFSSQNNYQGNTQGTNYNSRNQRDFELEDGLPVDISESDLPF